MRDVIIINIYFMGNYFKNSRQINVATLNYAGIAHSPFEFYSGTAEDRAEMDKLSQIFKDLFKKEFGIKEKEQIPQDNSKFLVEMKIIDKTMQRQRYSPLYRQDAGIIHGKLMDKDEFLKKWTEEYDKNSHYVKFEKAVQSNAVEECKRFDHVVYQTFKNYIYHQKIDLKLETKTYQHDIEKVEENLYLKRGAILQKWRQTKRQAIMEYENFLERQFSKAFLKLNSKLAAIKHILQDKDVLFLQDVSDELINTLKNEGNINIIVPPLPDCAILVKQSKKFSKLYDEQAIFKHFANVEKIPLLTQQAFQYNYYEFEPQNSPAICFIDDFLFISLHLHASQKDMKKMMEHLLDLSKDYPNLKIVVGGDFNCFLDSNPDPKKEELSNNFFTKFSVFPKTEKPCTTQKKRTWLQPQIKKSGKEDESCRDFILTNMIMEHAKIEKIEENIVGKSEGLLTEKHPFDHYIVSATVIT